MIPRNSSLVALRGANPTASDLAPPLCGAGRRGNCHGLRVSLPLRPRGIQGDPLAALVLVPDWLLKYKDVVVFWTSALAVGALFDTVLVRHVLSRILRVAADSLAPSSPREHAGEEGHRKGDDKERGEEEREVRETDAVKRPAAPVAETPESARRLMVASSALTALATTVSVRRAGRRALRPERLGKAAGEERASSRRSTPQLSSGGSRRQSRQLSSQAVQHITSMSRQVSSALRGQPRPQAGVGGASSSSGGKRSPRETPPRTPQSDTRSNLKSTLRDAESGSTPDMDQAPSVHTSPDSGDEELEVFKNSSSVHWAAGVESPQRKPAAERHKRFNEALVARRKSAAGLLLGNDTDRANGVGPSVRRTSSMPLSWDSLSTGEFKRQQTLDSADTLDMERGVGSHCSSFCSADFGDEGSDDDDEDEEEEEEFDDESEEYEEEGFSEEEEEDVGRVAEEDGDEDDEDESEDGGVREEWWRSDGEDEEGASEEPLLQPR